MLIIFYYSCSNFRGTCSFRASGQQYILKKLHCGSSPEVLDYASRNRLIAITINIHLTTLCKLTTYLVFIFHGPFAFVFTGTDVLEMVGQLQHGQSGRVVLYLSSAQLSFCSQYLWKGGEQKIFCVPIF